MKSKKELIKEQNKLLRLYAEARWRLRKYKGVVGIGVGAKETNGKITGDFAFRVYVREKKAVSELAADEIIPAAVKGTPTDVIVISEVEMLADDGKYRPLKGGVQVRNEYFERKNTRMLGTIGCLVEFNSAQKEIMGLSCQHVLLAGQAELNVKVGQPRHVVSCCCCTYHEIGKVTNFKKDNQVDCAVVVLDEEIEKEVKSGGTLHTVEGVGQLTGVAQAVCFEPVKKRGRTTELTTGAVVDVLYEGSQILIHPTGASAEFAKFGDSGSVIVNDALRVIGLLWATDRSTRTKGVANHIGPVMQALNILIAGADGAGLAIPASGCSSSSGP